MILITGATGNVGSELVRLLRAEGARFRAAFHSPEKARASDVQAVILDYARPETLPAAFEGVERLFLLSPPGAIPLEAAALEPAKRAGVKHIVKLSVWEADKEGYAFARAHQAIEKRVESSGIPFTFLRPNGFMQTYLLFAATIKAQSAFYLPARDSRYNIVDARDVAAVAAKVLTEPGHEGKAYPLAGPEALSNRDIAEKLSRALGRTVSYVDVTDEQFLAGAADSGMPKKLAEDVVDLEHQYIAGSFVGETPWIQRIAGREPGTFDRFAGDYAEAFR